MRRLECPHDPCMLFFASATQTIIARQFSICFISATIILLDELTSQRDKLDRELLLCRRNRLTTTYNVVQ